MAGVRTVAQVSGGLIQSPAFQRAAVHARAGTRHIFTVPPASSRQIPPGPRISVEAAAPGSEKGAALTRGSRHLKKMTEEYPTLPQGAEASLPLTGSASCGVSSILRKMWTRHKKKSEYVGATNSAFEAD
nr:uncharacterized protein C8orf46-like [Microcebus murinus]